MKWHENAKMSGFMLIRSEVVFVVLYGEYFPDWNPNCSRLGEYLPIRHYLTMTPFGLVVTGSLVHLLTSVHITLILVGDLVTLLDTS